LVCIRGEILNQKKRYKAIVDGIQYTIIGAETKEHLDLVTQMVDEQFRILKGKVKGASGEQSAILLAINSMSDLLKRQAENIVLTKTNSALQDELNAAEVKISALELEIVRANRAEIMTRQMYDEFYSKTPLGKAERVCQEASKTNPEAKQQILDQV